MSWHQLEDTSRLENGAAADIEFGLAKGDRPGRSRYPRRTFQPLTWSCRRKKVRIHADRQRYGLRLPPDSRAEQSIGKSHQHATVRDTTGIAVPLLHAHAVDKAVRRHFVEEWPIMRGVRPAARR